MIVQCEHCLTKYRIADEKVKGKGVKVRCAKCENVFTVAPPQEEDPTAVATQASISQDATTSEASFATPPSPENQAPEINSTHPKEDVEIPSHSGMAEEESASLPPLPNLDGSAESSASTSGMESDPPLDAHAGPPSDEQTADLGSQRPAHELDQTGVFTPNGEPSELPDDDGFKIEATLREDPSPEPLGTRTDDATGFPPPETYPDGEWGNITVEEQGSSDRGGGDLGLAGSPGYEPPPPVPFEEPADPDPFDLTGDTLPETSTVPKYQPEARTSGRGGKTLLAVLALAALGAGGYFAYPTIMEMVDSRTQQAEGTLTPANVQVTVLNRKDGETIYVVRGEVRNESQGNVGMIKVEAQFRNASGAMLGKASSYCGNIFEDSQLARLDLAKVRADLENELGQSLSNANVSPGGAVPFLMVLDNPPAGIDKVTVTISSFKETT